MTSSNPISNHRKTFPISCPDKKEVACEYCKLYGFLQLFGKIHMDFPSVHLLSQRPVAKGEILFHPDHSFHGVYAVQSGSFKSYSLLDHQIEQVIGFHLPGELLGLDAIQADTYGYCAMALETSRVCLLPFNHLDDPGVDIALFQAQIIKILVDQVKQDQRQTLLVGRRSAEERLGAFFLNLAERYAKHGFSSHEFRMPMLQNDIANYLGLSMETVSRTLRSFRENELLSIQGKRVRILNPSCLQSITQYCLASSSKNDHSLE
ncbi:MAG: helix-turn-helix domain-containing protein [Magnetococcus sp. YQC-5]